MKTRPSIPAAPTRNGHMPPDNYVPLVVISLVVFLPLGLVTLHHSRSVARHWQAGERDAARRASLSTLRWGTASLLSPVLIFSAIMLYWAFFTLNDAVESKASQYDARHGIECLME